MCRYKNAIYDDKNANYHQLEMKINFFEASSELHADHTGWTKSEQHANYMRTVNDAMY